MMTGRPITLRSPRYRVVLGDVDEPDTWVELEAQAITRDLQAAETLFARHKWGKPSDQAIKLTSVAAYYALRRTGQITGSWDEFEASYLEVSEAEVHDRVDPSLPAPDPA
jgi:hypothetical protein